MIKHKLQLLGIAKTWACKTLPGWDDQMHRDLLQRHGARALPDTQRVSARSMNAMQLEASLSDYEQRGWSRMHRTHVQQGVSRVVPERIAHLVRLWGRVANAGKVQNGSRAALLRWCERQVQHSVPNLDALTVPECQRLTEALKAWMVR
ncbi:phage protein GemA/Gp16 family protein [Limnohabitans sp.]|uniref:phage protein GemA/Gp16 family protein n=1 Tax=Limnohabitans sp. TaxID=1907725 RepID=UPI00286EB5DA|nr:phage protein GemA/Gp16 family protein [Limnohabitans sp.]